MRTRQANIFTTHSVDQSMMSVFKSLPPETRVELIHNELFFMSPSPRARHQEILGNLHVDISIHVRATGAGKVFIAPFDVYLDENFNVVQPDLIYLSGEKLHLIQQNGIHGTPDMIVEILSPWNPDHDRLRKKLLYEIFGVSEYFIVDPASKLVNGYRLVDGRFEAAYTQRPWLCSRLLNKQFML